MPAGCCSAPPETLVLINPLPRCCSSQRGCRATAASWKHWDLPETWLCAACSSIPSQETVSLRPLLPRCGGGGGGGWSLWCWPACRDKVFNAVADAIVWFWCLSASQIRFFPLHRLLSPAVPALSPSGGRSRHLGVVQVVEAHRVFWVSVRIPPRRRCSQSHLPGAGPLWPTEVGPVCCHSLVPTADDGWWSHKLLLLLLLLSLPKVKTKK